MNEATDTRLPKGFWVIAAIALVWNLLGVIAYVLQVMMSEEALAALPEAERLLMETTPAWATAAFAIAVFGGALGCVGLLLKKAWAAILLIISLAAVLVQMIYGFFVSNSYEVFGPGGMIMPVMVVAIAVFLVWYSSSGKTRGWLT